MLTGYWLLLRSRDLPGTAQEKQSKQHEDDQGNGRAVVLLSLARTQAAINWRGHSVGHGDANVRHASAIGKPVVPCIT